jgi:hypothetical protein
MGPPFSVGVGGSGEVNVMAELPTPHASAVGKGLAVA